LAGLLEFSVVEVKDAEVGVEGPAAATVVVAVVVPFKEFPRTLAMPQKIGCPSSMDGSLS
jgi:hypothetical protein